ncbi:hypothetical protein [Siphonobacter sp. BAB-5385]|uniref:hypothetical protein n=1 Tax=Siphonobacter sp. BAB-5385 TaxID=1864822 RepID=UPI0020CD55CC|nr:hypothetical protein [Siphonobacter sp. BAB-5385]
MNRFPRWLLLLGLAIPFLTIPTLVLTIRNGTPTAVTLTLPGIRPSPRLRPKTSPSFN